ncbi:hypothetical protein ASE17_06525 [Phenylobacterium sp. Root77]|uniref:DUF1254 domain-containing protein n=1 Tax=unclassified Phenylobacterium TaxID=2640670 RepID=UPI0006F2C449|nr:MULTISPECIES: DUF1254 domain-containing protein [unclassified Phenylobacterium]KQW68110.1 hypothetical protein ASC73_16430 [Phenylobacterium sp. Root1277]KQW91853.1 hypothetical protein ASC79_09805 [Phenylobacterium sp. Root1290]KRC40084.1 hypothetical protein ASE17_06525 [Phenylobacterium sp. Root77]
MASHFETNPFDVRRAAADGVVLGFPLLLVDAVRRTHPVGMNQILALPDDCSAIAPGLADDDELIVRASAWIDLSAGPILLSLPDLGGRHWAISLFDAWGERIARVDPRTHRGGVTLALAGPKWRGEAPEDVVARRSHTDLVWAVIRVAARDAADLEAARALLSKLAIAASEDDAQAPHRLHGRVDAPLQSALDALTSLSPHRLFHHLARLLDRYPADEGRDTAPLTAIGMTPGLAFHLPEEQALRDALTLGVADGFGRVIHSDTPSETAGWRRATPGADDAATAILACLGAAAPEDIQHWICDVDSDGRPLMGSEPYILRFPRGETPPTDGFWTLTLASRAPSGALRPDRHYLDSRNDLVLDPDGALTIRVEHQPQPPQSNWLPAPPGRLRLRLKLYWPKATALDGSWSPPAPERIGGVRRTPSSKPENRESPQ